MLEKRQIDGVILIGMNMPSSHIEKLQSDIPMVLLERDAGNTNLDSVKIDNRVGAYEAVRHLIQKGHSRIAHIPVSYTHLDVYKRQGKRPAVISIHAICVPASHIRIYHV